MNQIFCSNKSYEKKEKVEEEEEEEEGLPGIVRQPEDRSGFYRDELALPDSK